LTYSAGFALTFRWYSMRLPGTHAAANNAHESGRLLDVFLDWRPATRSFGEIPRQTFA
jgi:hypothetical protein